MIAKILSEDCVYYSPVFAVSINGTKNNAVVFDSTFSRLIVVDIFKKSQYTILFTNYDTEHFSINEEFFKSYWNDKNIFQIIKSGKYTPKMLEEARSLLKTVNPQAFTKIESSADLQALEINSGSFHDGYILGMQEKNGMLDILLDSSWGALFIIRCRGVIANTLELGQIFYHCDMTIADAYVELSFDPEFSNEAMVLKAEHIEFKSLFEKRIAIKRFDYSFSNGTLVLNNDCSQPITIDIAKNDILDFKERNVLGYLENDEIMHRFFLFSEDIVYSFHQYIGNAKRANNTTGKIQKFHEDCKQHGFLFDDYPLCDDHDEASVYDFGTLIYSQEYSMINQFVSLFQILIPIYALQNLIWLIVKLFEPQMKWTVYLIMGLGVCLITTLICLLAYWVGVIRDKSSDVAQHKRIEIYENGLKYNGYNVSFSIAYECITKVEYKKRLTIHMHGVKYTLHKSKNDRIIYELIKQKVSEDN